MTIPSNFITNCNIILRRSNSFIRGSSSSTGSFGHILVNGDGVSRVGIGTTTPEKQLHIKNTVGDKRGLMVETTVASSYAELQVKASKEFRIGTGGSSTSVANQFYVYDATSAVHRFDIDTDGNIGIGGGTSPDHRLDVRNAGETNRHGF